MRRRLFLFGFGALGARKRSFAPLCPDGMSTEFRLVGRPEQTYLLASHPNHRRWTMDDKVTAAEPFVREPAAGSPLDVLGVTHTYKATGAETAGSLSLWEAGFPPGTGAPP